MLESIDCALPNKILISGMHCISNLVRIILISNRCLLIVKKIKGMKRHAANGLRQTACGMRQPAFAIPRQVRDLLRPSVVEVDLWPTKTSGKAGNRIFILTFNSLIRKSQTANRKPHAAYHQPR